MGLTLKDIRTAKRTVAIDLTEFGYEGCDPLEVTYKTNFWSGTAQKQFVGSEGLVGDSIADLLANSIVEWNLTDDGTPVPVSAEVLNDLNFALVRGILDAMIEGISPNPLKTSGS